MDKRELIQAAIDRQGKDAALFVYVGKPKTLIRGEDLIENERSASVPQLRLNGLEKMKSIRAKVSKRGKISMRLIVSGVEVWLDARGISPLA